MSSDRRSLVEGLKSTPTVDPRREREFVYGDKAKPANEVSPATSAATISRSPLSTRIRSDFAVGLKRASLERQLSGVEPSTLQDILEEAIEPWLTTNGYLS